MVYNKDIAITKLQHEKGLLVKERKNLLSELKDLYIKQIAYIQYHQHIDLNIQDEINDHIERYNYTFNRIDTINYTLKLAKEVQLKLAKEIQ